ncbi:pleckstrin homology domain-containing family M member 1 [Microplitis demolitor]|uniref:pleckstrin homology domain-containing family M member 1 n=1 Tax=Microplitis demolitor TaxID=69319 RepID=UPI0004400161|nr:pleckstrin homology domain-containing family M member 1 [Microplitis demolitor]
MNSLLKSVKSIANKRHFLVKESLRKQLNATVMELQGVEGISEGTVGNCEETMALCSVLEAIFLHGLKDSLLNRVTEVLSGPDFDAMPQPSFWGPLLVFSHREMIDQILNLQQITTEVGYCRAWIRLAINEGLLSSYLSSIQRDDSALKPYYDRSAFIRDSDHIEVARRLIESLDSITFQLACNTSLLNFWSSTPLLMAAIWLPPMKSCPVFSAVDIAKTINSDPIDSSYNSDDVETASSIGSMGSFSSQSILNNVSALSEDDALRIILANGGRQIKIDDKGTRDVGESSRSRPAQEDPKTAEENDPVLKESKPEASTDVAVAEESVESATQIDAEEEKEPAKAEVVGNSLIGKLGWSTSIEEGESSMTSSMVSRGSLVEPRTPGDGATYDALIKSYHTAGYATSPDIRDFLDKYTPGVTQEQEEPKPEVKTGDNLEEQIGRLPREKGLDVQNYSCFDCGHAIGMTFSKAYVCGFSGNYFCINCMAIEEFLIPSRIIHNWDLKHYRVSVKAASYLTDCATLLNLKVLNPKIYAAVDSMAQLRTLRIQLNLLRAYLFTCREPIIESLQKKVSPRDYLYEHVHQYSVSDLLDVPSGSLAQQLQKIVEFARNHVLNCWLCSQKGFICEICNNPKVIYPFDMASTYRCGECNAVFHADCLNSKKPCPKCERKRKRTDRPPIDAQESTST